MLKLIVEIDGFGLNEIFLLSEVNLLNLYWLIFYLVDNLKGLEGHFFLRLKAKIMKL